MNPAIPYIACVVGAAGLYLLLRPDNGARGRAVKGAGALIGLGAFAWLLAEATRRFGTQGTGEKPLNSDTILAAIFSLIAIASAARMITHSKPVYCALYFVMVVLSSAGLFLILQAEFMAFALIIVYAGAILITYMFVLMLAHQSPSDPDASGPTDYDKIPREPGMAVTVGFIMLALFTNMIFGGTDRLPRPASLVEVDRANWNKLQLMPGAVRHAVEKANPGAVLPDDWKLSIEDGVAWVNVIRPGETQPTSLRLPPDAAPSNVQLVGLDLVTKFPVSLELAGVILLLAMFGAVVLARKQIELGEDEVREAAGMRQLAFHADEQVDYGPIASEGAKGGTR